MKIPRPVVLLFAILLVGCKQVAPVAQDTSPATLGIVRAFIVNGNVRIHLPNGQLRRLERNDTFSEGSTVIVGRTGDVLLVFSNGATLKVLPGSELRIDKFRQALFDENKVGTFLRLDHDPSRSNVVVSLRLGNLQGEVKKLNEAAGSSFLIETDKGTFDIRDYFRQQTQVAATAPVF